VKRGVENGKRGGTRDYARSMRKRERLPIEENTQKGYEEWKRQRGRIGGDYEVSALGP